MTDTRANERSTNAFPGSSEDDRDDALDVDDTGDDTDDAGDASGDAEYTPPSKDEWERTQAALKKANGEAKKHRIENKRLKGGGNGAGGHAADQGGVGSADVEAAREAAEAKYKPVAVRASARAAFIDAGLNDATSERVSKLLRLIDVEGVEIDEDGDVIGLEDQVAAIKADYPELFVKAERKRVPRVNGADRKPADGKAKTASERQAASILRR